MLGPSKTRDTMIGYFDSDIAAESEFAKNPDHDGSVSRAGHCDHDHDDSDRDILGSPSQLSVRLGLRIMIRRNSTGNVIMIVLIWRLRFYYKLLVSLEVFARPGPGLRLEVQFGHASDVMTNIRVGYPSLVPVSKT